MCATLLPVVALTRNYKVYSQFQDPLIESK